MKIEIQTPSPTALLEAFYLQFKISFYLPTLIMGFQEFKWIKSYTFMSYVYDKMVLGLI